MTIDVSIRAPVQRATRRSEVVATIERFRSAPPCRGRLGTRVGGRLVRAFRSAPPCRGRRGTARCPSRASRFRSAPPCRGRRSRFRRGGTPGFRFDPRPRAEGDQHRPRRAGDQPRVSIRAPVQRATCHTTSIRRRASHRVSIRAPVQRATCCASGVACRSICFDPRPRAEGDPTGCGGWTGLTGFDPRPRAEGDSVCRSRT